MLTLRDIAARYELSPKQARRYWEAVSPLLTQYARRGPHNTILLSEQAIPVLDRLAELVRSGLSLPAAAEQLRGELNGSGQAESKQMDDYGQTDYRDELISVLKAQLAEKDRQIAELLAQLRELQQRALPPAGARRWWRPWSWPRLRREAEIR